MARSSTAARSTSGPHRLELAHRWFERYGAPVDPRLALIPVVRAAFPYAAGVSRMPYWRFVPLATLGSIPWIAGLGVSGKAVGSNWKNWRHHLDYVDYAVVALLVLGDRVPDRRRRRRGERPDAEPRMRVSVARPPPLGEALALGALHGPAELLPISSSGHIEVVPMAPGLALLRARRRASQVVRGRAPRRHGGGAADHPARRGRRRGRRSQPPADRQRRLSASRRRRSSATRSSARSSGGSGTPARSPPV